MPEKKKSFREFLANDALNPGVRDDKLQKIDVGSRDAAEDENGKTDKKAIKAAPPKIKKAPVALFGILCLVFLGLTIGLTFVTPWCLFGIIPTLLCFWKMVLNNADNNYKSVVDRYDSDYLERIDSKEKEKQRCQELEEEIEEKKKKTETKEEEEDEEKEVEEKKKKERKGKKSSKPKDKDEDEIDDFDDDEEEEEEEEKKSKKAEKSDKKFGSKVEKSGKRDVENENSRTSLIERNKRIRGQRTMY